MVDALLVVALEYLAGGPGTCVLVLGEKLGELLERLEVVVRHINVQV